MPTDPTVLALLEELECGMCAGVYIDVSQLRTLPARAVETLGRTETDPTASRTQWLRPHLLWQLRCPMDQGERR